MLKLFSAFRKEKIWDFDGGIHPPEMKTQSNGTPLRQIPLATRYVMPLKQHIGAADIALFPVFFKGLHHPAQDRFQPLINGFQAFQQLDTLAVIGAAGVE